MLHLSLQQSIVQSHFSEAILIDSLSSGHLLLHADRSQPFVEAPAELCLGLSVLFDDITAEFASAACG